MLRKSFYTCLLFIGVLISSCAVSLPVTATGNSVQEATKTGVSKATLLFGTIPLGGDASIHTAAKNGNINEISIVDIKTTSYLFVYTIETTVHGN